MFDGSTEDLPSYIPGYDEWLEEQEQETDYAAYDKYIERLIDEQILERLEKEEKDEQKSKKTIWETIKNRCVKLLS